MINRKTQGIHTLGLLFHLHAYEVSDTSNAP